MRPALWSIRTLVIGGTLGLILSTAAAILVTAFLVGRSAVDAESEPLMVAALADIIERSEGFLASAERIAVMTQGVLEASAFPADEPDRMERILFEIVRGHPGITAAYYGTSNGSFAFVTQDPEQESKRYLTKIISVGHAHRQVEVKHRDRNFALLDDVMDPTDPFDPRTRPWYAAAMSASGNGWTEPYVYWTSGEPGISVARPINCGPFAGSTSCVVAVDITLSRLSRFLATLRVGRSGTAFIVTRSNRVIAFSRPQQLVAEEKTGAPRDLTLRLKQSDELGDQALMAALGSLGAKLADVDLPEIRQTQFALDGRTYLASFAAFAPFQSQGLPWLVGIYLPQGDFFDWFFDQQRAHLYLGLVVAGLMTVLAILLSYSLIRPLERIRGNAIEVSKGRLGAFDAPESRLAEFRETEQALSAMARILTDHRQAMAMALEQSVRAGQAKSEFLSRMSHELRTPLNAIIGFADLLQLRLTKSGGAKELEYLQDMRSAGEQLLAVLARILQFAGLEEGRLSLDEGRFSLDDCVRGACQPLQRLIDDKKLQMSLELDAGIELQGDLAKLRQAVGQVLSNAIRYSPVEGTVSVTARRCTDGGAEIVIKDRGTGMTAAETELALQPFLRAAANPYIAGEAGMGLGLPIARALCELHGGSLRIASRPGEGTTVTLVLPAQRVVPAEALAAVSQKAST